MIAYPVVTITNKKIADDDFMEQVNKGFDYEPEIKAFNKRKAFERDMFDAAQF